MQDLTQGSITRHLLSMAGFLAIGLIFQTLYYLVDLFFVAQLGNEAVAGVSAAGNAFFLVLAASQLVSVGAIALVAQAIGRKDSADANVVANQSLSLALAGSVLTLVLGYAFADQAVASITADPQAARLGKQYLHAFLPSLALVFPSVALSSSLRGAGVVMPPMLVQTAGVIINAILAPILITGWLTGAPMGVVGAGLASSIASLLSVGALFVIYPRIQPALRISREALRPRRETWKRLIAIGFPTSLEFLLMFIIFGVIYFAIRDFGAPAQAGFGIGGRLMQSMFLPAMAVAFSAAPVVGQNFGAKRYDRVRETFRQAALISSAIMLALAIFAHWQPGAMIAVFTQDPATTAIAAEYLQITSWNFVASGIAMAASSTFQGLGDTRPALLASASRLVTFVIPTLWLSFQPFMQLHHVWYLSVFSVAVQMLIALVLVLRVMRRKLGPAAPLTASAS